METVVIVNKMAIEKNTTISQTFDWDSIIEYCLVWHHNCIKIQIGFLLTHFGHNKFFESFVRAACALEVEWMNLTTFEHQQSYRKLKKKLYNLIIYITSYLCQLWFRVVLSLKERGQRELLGGIVYSICTCIPPS